MIPPTFRGSSVRFSYHLQAKVSYIAEGGLPGFSFFYSATLPLPLLCCGHRLLGTGHATGLLFYPFNGFHIVTPMMKSVFTSAMAQVTVTV